MKEKSMKNLKNKLFAILKDESAQGMAEYALLLVVVIAIATLFKGQIMAAVTAKLNEIKSGMASVTTGG